MIRGIYTTGSGMITLQREMNIRSNNLANINTPGFKKETMVTKSFPGKDLARTNDRVRLLPIGYREPRPELGHLNTGTTNDGSYTDFSQGILERTGNPLDLGIQGEGFFTVRLADGTEAYTRNGSFKLSSDRLLVTSNGRPVMGQEGPIRIQPEVSDVRVIDNGQIVDQNNQLLGQLRMVQFENPQHLRQMGDNLYRQGENNPIREELEEFVIQQGYLERSNTSPTKELINLIEVNRSYEMHTRVLRQQDRALQSAIQNVGRV